MALSKLVFKPGLNRDQTNYASEGGWYECDKVRFRSGFPEKIGGWLKYTSLTPFVGICRAMLNWVTTDGNNLLCIATNKKVYVEVGTVLHDITPVRATFITPTTNNCLATTAGSTTIEATIVAHGALTGDYVALSGVAGPIDGIPASEFNTDHLVTTLTANTFSFTVTTAASGTTAAAGGVVIIATFDIHAGNEVRVYGAGFGVGSWGRGAWGSSTTPLINDRLRLYSLDNFGSNLVFNINGGDLYYWTYDSTFATRAVLVSSKVGATDVPTLVTTSLLSQINSHYIAFGCTNYSTLTYDPMLIRWSNQNDPLNWTPTATNSSGFIRLSNGSGIVGVQATRQEIVVLTDSGAYSLQYTGTTEVFQAQALADNISVAGQSSMATANNIVFWMGRDKFYAYSGRVDTLPCTLRQEVFGNINKIQFEMVVAGTNEKFNEVIWFYPSETSTSIDRYVIYNYLESLWYYGTVARTAWLDSPLRDYPQACKSDGYVYDHEKGVDDDTLPMTAYISSGDVDLQDGTQFMLTRRLIPDVNFNGSTVGAPGVVLTITPRNFPGAPYGTNVEGAGIAKDITRSSIVPVEQYTQEVFLRVRGRQISFTIASSTLGTQWQLGMPRVDMRPDGAKA